MTGKKWIAACSYFLQPHPVLFAAGEKVYIPKDGLTIVLWFDGGLRVSGDKGTLQLNFNAPDHLVLASTERGRERVIRVPWDRLVAFELEWEGGEEAGGSDWFLNGRSNPNPP